MIKQLFKRAALGLALAAATLAGSSAKADFTVTLDTLVGPNYGTSVTNNGLKYTNFSYTPQSNTGVALPPASAITVHGFKIGQLDTLEFIVSASVGAGKDLDLRFSYEVDVVSGPKITDGHVSYTGFTTGNGLAVVSDTYYDNVTGLPIGAISATTPTGAVIVFGGSYSSIFVSKDAQLNGGTGTAGYSVITQQLSRGAVPEPASMAMLAMGGIGMIGAARRRRNKAQA